MITGCDDNGQRWAADGEAEDDSDDPSEEYAVVSRVTRLGW